MPIVSKYKTKQYANYYSSFLTNLFSDNNILKVKKNQFLYLPIYRFKQLKIIKVRVKAISNDITVAYRYLYRKNNKFHYRLNNGRNSRKVQIKLPANLNGTFKVTSQEFLYYQGRFSQTLGIGHQTFFTTGKYSWWPINDMDDVALYITKHQAEKSCFMHSLIHPIDIIFDKESY